MSIATENISNKYHLPNKYLLILLSGRPLLILNTSSLKTPHSLHKYGCHLSTGHGFVSLFQSLFLNGNPSCTGEKLFFGAGCGTWGCLSPEAESIVVAKVLASASILEAIVYIKGLFCLCSP